MSPAASLELSSPWRTHFGCHPGGKGRHSSCISHPLAHITAAEALPEQWGAGKGSLAQSNTSCCSAEGFEGLPHPGGSWGQGSSRTASLLGWHSVDLAQPDDGILLVGQNSGQDFKAMAAKAVWFRIFFQF